jgi:hypothetical protein
VSSSNLEATENGREIKPLPKIQISAFNNHEIIL